MIHSIRLGEVQETLLIPLFAGAVESRRKHPILEDSKAVEMVEAIDWDFQRFKQRRRVIARTLRSAIFDEWIKEFLRRHPEGTVVEIGAGLNTRFERLDNGRLRWVDFDLRDTVELRRKFFTGGERRITLAGSVLEPEWMATVRENPGPYFFVAEAVFVYLEERAVKAAVAEIARNFPGASIAFDTATRKAVDGGHKDFARTKMAARFAWACEDPVEVERWNIGLHVVESRSLVDVPDALRPRLSWPLRTAFRFFNRACPKLMRAYQLNLFAT
jgi:O-methyltransferase involved in polyketide biosynthesis